MAQTTETTGTPSWSLDILLIDESSNSRDVVVELLHNVGHRVHAVETSSRAMVMAKLHAPSIAIAILGDSSIERLALSAQLRKICPDLQLIFVAATPRVEDALMATHLGAEYLRLPLSAANLLGPVAAVSRRRELHANSIGSREDALTLVGNSPLIKALRHEAKLVALAGGPVLITGEPGTGKELVARLVHKFSPRSDRPLVHMRCESMTTDEGLDPLLQFGGFLDQAKGATLLLDNVEALPSVVQTALMDNLRSGRFSAEQDTNVRFVAITRADLLALATGGAFRADLAAAFQELRLRVPPLRHRRDDLPLLASYFSRRHTRPGATVPPVSAELWKQLVAAEYPDNLHGLERVIKQWLAQRASGDRDRKPATAAHKLVTVQWQH